MAETTRGEKRLRGEGKARRPKRVPLPLRRHPSGRRSLAFCLACMYVCVWDTQPMHPKKYQKKRRKGYRCQCEVRPARYAHREREDSSCKLCIP